MVDDVTDKNSQKRILGIIGGMSWVSTLSYYRALNEAVQAAKGRQHSAELLIVSIDFQAIVDAQVKDDWDAAARILSASAAQLERAGAGALLIASNTMHRVLDDVRKHVAIPALDIFDATAAAAHAAGFRRVGLLGTRYTMSHKFYRHEFERRGLDVIVPEPQDARRINEIIFRELIRDRVLPESAAFYRQVVQQLAAAGAQGVVLGCTEIGMLLSAEASTVPLLDTAQLHAAMGARWLLDQAGS